ncbi:MAG: hypothetical protein ACTHK6_09350 [Solirubrobacterales bacterium]
MLGVRDAIGLLTARQIVYAVSATFAACFLTMALIGVTTDVISNPWFERKVPVETFDWIVLVAISLLTGALAGTYFLGQSSLVGTRIGAGSGVLGWFAVSCPLCNKVVLVLLGTSGATSVFEPLQPVLGGLAVALALVALAVRIRMLLRGTCPVPAPPPMASAKPKP